MLAVLPAAVRWGPPPWNSEQECATTLGPTNTKPGNADATSAIAASCSGGTAIVSPAVGAVGQSMLFGPRICVTRSMRRTVGHLALKLFTACVIPVRHSAWVLYLKLTVPNTSRSGAFVLLAHVESTCAVQKLLCALAHSST